MDSIALRVEHLTKEYRLGTIGYGTLREDLQSWWARVRGKEDPNSLVTAKHHTGSEQKHFFALDDISFEVKKGDRLGIIGRNGAGKSTLLKVLSHITSPTKGSVFINGRIGSLLEVGTGFHRELTGRENIYLNGAILGMKRWEIDKKLDEIVAFAGVERFIDTPVKRYSSGMFVRLGFAVAAHLNTELMIVDEVLAVGDIEFQNKAIKKMQSISNDRGKTILFVSHNMEMIRKLCNYGLLLNTGKIIESNPNIETVITKYFSLTGERYCTIWKNTYNEYVNAFFHIKKVFLTDSKMKSTKGIFVNTDQIILNIELNIKIIDNSIAIGYWLYNQSGQLIYISGTADTEQERWPIWKIREGILKTQIPRRLLNEGSYVLRIGATNNAKRNDIIDEKAGPSVSFRIQGGMSDSPFWTQGSRPGIIAPIIPWTIEY
jgi:lipopolysaccharide transport system ATP-binding protein